MKKIIYPLLSLVAVVLLYLLLWPVPISPVKWTPPVAPRLEGVYAVNDKLKDVQRFGVDAGVGPEGINIDAMGRIYAGYLDGRVVMFSNNGSSYQELGSTGGRPLGIGLDPAGGVVVADADKGLLQVGAGKATALSTAAEDQPFALTDDVDFSRLGRKAYFSDAAAYPLSKVLAEFLEHRGTGRLLEYDLDTKATRVLLKGLLFANGIAVGPDDAYVLVNETAAYRVTRYWLKGDKAGRGEVFIDNLPGLPDNISYDPVHRRFWLALYAPRADSLDGLADKPAWIKKLAYRLPAFVQPKPAHKAWVLGLDESGQVIANLQYEAPDAYGPITSVRESGPWLYFGSLSADSLARLPLQRVFADAPPPPANWQQLNPRPHHFVPPKVGDDSAPVPAAQEGPR